MDLIAKMWSYVNLYRELFTETKKLNVQMVILKNKLKLKMKNDNLSLLAVKGFFHDCWQMKYKSPRVLFRAVATLK